MLALCASAAIVAGAFCASPARAASDPDRAQSPAQSVAQSAAPAATPVQAAPVAPIADAPPPPPAPAQADIALVLPLASPDYARAAEAVRDGFLDAADAAGARARVTVIGHGAGEVVAAFTRARDAGAHVIVGPLVRDDLKALAAADISLPPTIALNQLDDGTPLPPLIYTLALAVESDARVIARRARADGAMSASVIEADTPLMKRFAGAFTAEWLLEGGDPPRRFSFTATPDGLAKLRRDLADAPADVVVIAVEGSDAALVKSFAPHVTTYASAQINRSASLGTMRDLDDTRVVDLPWLVTPDLPAFARLPHKHYSSVALDRLYALGLDAFRVADAFRGGVPSHFELDGATGRLELDEGRQIARAGALAVFRQGVMVPLESTP
jgi:outer membrane PBP1 activator LpoA protein